MGLGSAIGGVQQVGPTEVIALFRNAEISPRKRAHLLLHGDHADQVQRLLIACCVGTYFRPQYHIGQRAYIHWHDRRQIAPYRARSAGLPERRLHGGAIGRELGCGSGNGSTKIGGKIGRGIEMSGGNELPQRQPNALAPTENDRTRARWRVTEGFDAEAEYVVNQTQPLTKDQYR